MTGIVELTNFGGSIGGVASALGNLAADFGVGIGWENELCQASIAGVPFAVEAAAGSAGRKVAVHEYPFRDGAWAEDLGKKSRAFWLTGFLIENSAVYGGGSVIQQLRQLMGVCETSGAQSVVHPLLGSFKATVLDFGWEARRDDGRIIMFRLLLLKGIERVFPVSQTTALDGAISDLQQASALDMIRSVAAVVNAGAAVVRAAVSTVVSFVTSVYRLVHDVRRVFNSVSNLSGNFGRLFGAGHRGYAGSNTDGNTNSTPSKALASSVAKTATVSSSAAALQAAASNISTDQATFVSAAQTLMASVSSATTSPIDAINTFSTMSRFTASSTTTASVIGTSMAVMQTAVAALLRRAAIAELAAAAGSYQPPSYADALAVRDVVVAAIDSEITVSGDAGDDASYMALKALRQAVVSDLTDRAAKLSSMADYRFQASLPALALAQQLYQDAARADELILEAGAVHPAFMPLGFTALAE